jgi:hypothetical protein
MIRRHPAEADIRQSDEQESGAEPGSHRQQAVGRAPQQRNQQNDQQVLQQEHADHEPPEGLEQLPPLLEEAHHHQGGAGGQGEPDVQRRLQAQPRGQGDAGTETPEQQELRETDPERGELLSAHPARVQLDPCHEDQEGQPEHQRLLENVTLRHQGQLPDRHPRDQQHRDCRQPEPASYPEADGRSGQQEKDTDHQSSTPAPRNSRAICRSPTFFETIR